MVKGPAFSIIPKVKEIEPVWVVAVFWSLIGFLVLTIVPILIFQRQATSIAQKKVATEAEIEQIIKDNATLSQRMTLVSRRLNDFSQLLKNHRLRLLKSRQAFIPGMCTTKG